MDYEYDYNAFPLAYLITLRTYGTWLHGEAKLSVDRHGFNVYKTPRREANTDLENLMSQNLKQNPFLFDETRRKNVETTIAEVCKHRDYQLLAVNVRTNHIHAVISVRVKPKLVAEAFKSYSTRRLREGLLINRETKVWARGNSRRYLWKPRHVALAIEYVLYGQGDVIADISDCPEFDD